MSHLTKIHPTAAELFHSDGQTDRHDEANSRFSQFCERAQKFSSYRTVNTSRLLYKGQLTLYKGSLAFRFIAKMQRQISVRTDGTYSYHCD
jgi:hypothetical protein